MTTKEIKRYLNGARNLKKQIEILETTLSNIVEENVNIVPQYGKEYVKSSSVSNPTEQLAVNLEDIRHDLIDRRKTFFVMLSERSELIDETIPVSSPQNLILKYRYIFSMSWNNISKECVYNYKYLMRLHSTAIKHITKYVNDNSYWISRIKGDL